MHSTLTASVLFRNIDASSADNMFIVKNPQSHILYDIVPHVASRVVGANRPLSVKDTTIISSRISLILNSDTRKRDTVKQQDIAIPHITSYLTLLQSPS